MAVFGLARISRIFILRLSPPLEMNFDEIRRLVIIAMFSDDVLMQRLVLKGGNALDLVHHLTSRSSVDIDLSLEDDFTDLEDVRGRIFRALSDRFEAAGYVVFDQKFEPKPSVVRPGQSPKWGGYQVEFKIIPMEIWSQLRHKEEALRRNAYVVGPSQQRVFIVDISKYEYCEGKDEVQFEEYTIYVYTLPMIAIEKLRAICQQLPGYHLMTTPRGRARDFFDVYNIVTCRHVDLTTIDNRRLVRNIFGAKEVPVSFLSRIHEQRDFHRLDWPSVQDSAGQPIGGFDDYFDFVVELGNRLHALGIP